MSNEAGPSTWRRRQASEETASSILSQGDYTEYDPEDILREQELRNLEDDLLNISHSRSTINSTQTLRTPHPSFRHAQSTNSIPKRRPKPIKRLSRSSLDRYFPTSVSALDLEIPSPSTRVEGGKRKGMIVPGLTRQTTYSSLPPSPRIDSYEEGIGGGLGVRELEDVLGLLSGSGMRKEGLGLEDEFWEAEDGVDRREMDEIQTAERTREEIRSPSPDEAVTRDGGERIGISLWDLLRDEAEAEEWEGWIVDGKWERIANFMAVPLAVEKITTFGSLLCLDNFLYNFTILPLRAMFAIFGIASSLTSSIRSGNPFRIAPSHLQSVFRILLLVIPTIVLLMATDASKMYHTVRGQDTIKLYVIFNALEIGDRLCCAFGQDVLDTLFAKETLSPTNKKSGRGRKRQQARPLFFFMLSLGYVLVHTLIYFYMLVSLNVAINSYDYTLLSLLISNQFVEIKGSVFKKFEKENLFQIMCADIVERFQLGLMLSIIAIRNMIEMAGSDIAFLPKSFVRGKSLVDAILSPVLFVIVSEMIVDWLKHAFITKFNHVRASVYGRFMDVLAKDVLLAGTLRSGGRNKGRNHPILLDQSPLVARRLGFASLPLSVLVLRIASQAIGMLATPTHQATPPTSWLAVSTKYTAALAVGICAWGCLVALKVMLGLGLLSFAAVRQSGMEEREREDEVNDLGRGAVGEGKEETAYNKETKRYLSKEEDDLPEYTSPMSGSSGQRGFGQEQLMAVAGKGEKGAGVGVDKGSNGGSGGKGKKWKLEEVERWTMVKRIW